MNETCWHCGYFMPTSPVFNDGTQKTNFCRMRWDRVPGGDPMNGHCMSWFPRSHIIPEVDANMASTVEARLRARKDLRPPSKEKKTTWRMRLF